jgi:hypothetical protein
MSGSSAQRCAERGLECLRVQPDLALVHQTLDVLVNELDRIFDRDDVVGAVLVDEVDHRRERCRLAGARRSGHDHEALRQPAEIHARLRQSQLLGGDDLDRDLAHDAADAVPVLEHVHAEAREAGDFVGEVRIAQLGEVLLALVGDDLLHERVDVGARHRGVVLREMDLAMHAQDRVIAGGEMEVGRLRLEHVAEQRVDLRGTG